MECGAWRQWWVEALGVALALLLASGALPAQRKPKEQKPSKDQKSNSLANLPDDRAIDVAIGEMLAAWQLGDVEMLHKHYADDVTVVSGAWESPLVGWPKYLKAYQNQRERLQSPRLDRSNTLITVRGNLAWAVYQWEFNGMVDGKPSSERGHTTLVLERRQDRWVIVHNHTSIVAQPVQVPPPDAPKPSPPGDGAAHRAG